MRRVLFSLVLCFTFLQQPALAAQWPKEVTDILGNKVTLEEPPKRIILASGFSVLSLLFVDPNITNKMVAWGSELKRFDERTYELLLTQLPQLANIPTIGSGNASELSAEVILSLQPDLVIFDAWQAEGSQALTDHLKKAGIKFVYIDYYMSPLEHTLPSTRLLSQILDREQASEPLISYYQSHMQKLTSRLNVGPVSEPNVFLHAYAGVWNCCWSSGSGGIGEYIRLFHGKNIGASLFNNANGGNLNMEYILTQDPDIYIATGHSGVDSNKGLPIGTGIDKALSVRQLHKIVSVPGLNALTAVAENRVYGLWNYFSGSPFNLVAAEILAKWIQPELYRDIDPQKTMDEMNEQFFPVPLRGTYWVNP